MRIKGACLYLKDSAKLIQTIVLVSQIVTYSYFNVF